MKGFTGTIVTGIVLAMVAIVLFTSLQTGYWN